MSRCYEITIRVTKHSEAKAEAIVDAVKDLDYKADADFFGGAEGEAFGGKPDKEPEIVFNSETFNLRATYPETDCAREVTEAIWTANGAWCYVEVGLRDLDAHCPDYSWGEDAYDEWMKDQPKSRS